MNVIANDGDIEKEPILIVPSGTGATSYYLAKHLEGIKVCTVSIAERNDDLQATFNNMDHWPKLYPDIPCNHPIILDSKYVRFAQPKTNYLEIYNAVKAQGIELDLIYAPRALSEAISESNLKNHMKNNPIYYLHTGGTTGNHSQQARYTKTNNETK